MPRRRLVCVPFIVRLLCILAVVCAVSLCRACASVDPCRLPFRSPALLLSPQLCGLWPFPLPPTRSPTLPFPPLCCADVPKAPQEEEDGAPDSERRKSVFPLAFAGGNEGKEGGDDYGELFTYTFDEPVSLDDLTRGAGESGKVTLDQIAEYLTVVQLPGITRYEQIGLMGMVETARMMSSLNGGLDACGAFKCSLCFVCAVTVLLMSLTSHTGPPLARSLPRPICRLSAMCAMQCLHRDWPYQIADFALLSFASSQASARLSPSSSSATCATRVAPTCITSRQPTPSGVCVCLRACGRVSGWAGGCRCVRGF